MTRAPKIEWDVPAYLPYVQPPLTDDSVRAAEKSLGLRLPLEYIAALREQNGGYLRIGWRNYAGRTLWGIGRRYPSILEGSVKQRFASVDDVWLPRKADKLIPFVGDGHWHLCFDARRSSDEPAVAYVDIESEHHRVVAASFAQFLCEALLIRDEALHVGLISDVGLEDAARRLGAALGMKISHQDESFHGYEMFHGASTRRGSSSQVWISRNEVPRGFVRPDDDEYHALINTHPGTALRYREHPDCALIVEYCDLTSDELLAACARAGLPARTL